MNDKDDYDVQHDSDLRHSEKAAEIIIGGQEQERLRIPPSIIKPAKRKRVDVEARCMKMSSWFLMFV
jgi:hypothetical protein